MVYCETTAGIKISVLSEHLSETSVPEDDVFAFSYTVTIENVSATTVQLLERHWKITSGQVQLTEIVGPGVTGEQPVLEAGELFQYTSGAVIQDPFGFMEGSYTFRTVDGKYLEVAIPKFDLSYPLVIH